MSDIPVIAFGPNPETYYIGMGMRYYAPNIPPSAQGTVRKWPAIQVKWMSIKADGAFVARDAYSSQDNYLPNSDARISGTSVFTRAGLMRLRTVEYDTRVTPAAISKITVNPCAQYITFGSQKGHYCAIMLELPDASGYMDSEMIKELREADNSVGGPDEFTRTLNGILFGKSRTMIFMFKGFFGYSTDKEAKGGRLEKLLDEYMNRRPLWTIERGSSLCPWNMDYYFLKFKNTQDNGIMMHWNLPNGMSKQLAELKETLATPEAQQVLHCAIWDTLTIADHEQLGMVQAINNFALPVHTANVMRPAFGPYEYRWY